MTRRNDSAMTAESPAFGITMFSSKERPIYAWVAQVSVVPALKSRSERLTRCASQGVLLFRLDARVLDDLAPFLHLSFQERRKFLRRAAHRFRTVELEALSHFRQLHDAYHFG